MQRLFIYLVFCVLTFNANAQTAVTDSVKTYIEIYSWHKSSTPTIDTGEGKGTETYKTEEGQVIKFHSAIGAVNWFVGKGWKLESEHMATCNDRSVKMYVVSKKVPTECAASKLDNYINK